MESKTYDAVGVTVVVTVPEASNVCEVKGGAVALLVVNSCMPKVTAITDAVENGRRICASW